MFIRALKTAIAATVLSAAALSPSAAADKFPEQPVRLVVVYQAGGANDIVARILAEHMSTTLDQSVMVLNRPGAAGAVGAQFVVNSAADGHTILMGGAPLVVARALYNKPAVDFRESLDTVGKAVNLNLVLVARNEFPADSFEQLVEMEKKNPGDVTMAVTASTYELYHARINGLAGTDILKVPYPGVPAAMNDLNGNRVDLLIDTVAAQQPFLGKSTKPLAVFGRQRLESMPDVPTLSELGLAGFDDQPYIGMLVPKGTPQPVIEKLNASLNAALTDPGVKKKLEDLYFTVESSTPEAFYKEMEADSDKLFQVAEEAGIEKQ
ncbi:tripartite tricarboxylate transporter substrate binding protein [Achromobacter sp. F4_2707]|uniref:Bug family tripartite tricarboxylate transporter substrate binding protein n=1 Tax=Achromobacter sp. F4_2707 TaxID=3114286 RepID=UPI0039C6E924